MKIIEIQPADLGANGSLAAAFLTKKIESGQLMALCWQIDDSSQLAAVKKTLDRLDVPTIAGRLQYQFCLPLPALNVLLQWLPVFDDRELTESVAQLVNDHQIIWQAGRFRFDLTTNPIVYGILNVTPDSFYDGGRFIEATAMRKHIAAMVQAGAQVIEVGGQSTRRDRFSEVSSEEEIRRITPAIKYLHERYPAVAIAVDTYKAPVLKAALRLGIDIANDVHGFADEEMRHLIANSSVGLVTMYMAANHDYDNLTVDMRQFFTKRLADLRASGVAWERIALDEGIGYAAHLDGYQDFAMMRSLDQLLDFRRPLMVAISRKGFAKRLFNLAKKDRLPATLVAETYMALHGGRILRVHDVAVTTQLVQLLDQIQRGYWARSKNFK